MRLRRPGAGLEAPLWRGEALAWAARGAWDDAMTAADRWASASGDGDGALGAYRLGVAGVLTGGLMPASARGRRPTSTRALSRWSDFQKAELLWLDGVLAYLDHNPQRMGAVRRALAADTAPHRPLLDRSLAALAAEAGEIAKAQRAQCSNSKPRLPIGRPSVISSPAIRCSSRRTACLRRDGSVRWARIRRLSVSSPGTSPCSPPP